MTAVFITGCARSGTKYLATVLEAAGVSATHERSRVRMRQELSFARCGAVEVNSDGGFRVDEIAMLPEIKAIGHVVRHPQRVVASIVGRGMWYASGVRTAGGEMGGWGRNREEEYPPLRAERWKDWRDLDRSLLYWIYHNQRIDWGLRQRQGLYVFAQRFVIDQPGPALNRLVEVAGLEVPGLDAALAATPRDVNAVSTHPPFEYDWNEHDPQLRAHAERMWERYRSEAARPLTYEDVVKPLVDGVASR